MDVVLFGMKMVFGWWKHDGVVLSGCGWTCGGGVGSCESVELLRLGCRYEIGQEYWQ